jgi:hypothetical protein
MVLKVGQAFLPALIVLEANKVSRKTKEDFPFIIDK